MSRLFSAFLLFMLIFSRLCVSGQQVYVFPHNGQNRTYTLYVPEELPGSPPLVFVLHGYGSSSSQIMAYAEMNRLADQHRFVVCYPQGTPDFTGIPHWNARLGISRTDDIGFLSDLAQYLQDVWDLDPERTFSCGHSNGGFMSYTLACEAPDVFRAIASMAGTMSGYTWENREMAVPVPVLQIHGVNDQTVPIDGSIPWNGWAGAPHLDSVMAYWAGVNECAVSLESFLPAVTRVLKYTKGVAGNEVWYYKLENWGHQWPGSLNASHTGTHAGEVIWEFFEKMGSRTTHSNSPQTDLTSWSLYPNPARSLLYVHSEVPLPDEYRIRSLTGKLLLSGHTDGAHTTIDLSALPAGCYLFEMNRQVKRLLIHE